jgi:hypothetical protein
MLLVGLLSRHWPTRRWLALVELERTKDRKYQKKGSKKVKRVSSLGNGPFADFLCISQHGKCFFGFVVTTAFPNRRKKHFRPLGSDFTISWACDWSKKPHRSSHGVGSMGSGTVSSRRQQNVGGRRWLAGARRGRHWRAYKRQRKYSARNCDHSQQN